MMIGRKEWLQLLGAPENWTYEPSLKLVKKTQWEDFVFETYLQANGISPDGEPTYQRVVLGLPKNAAEKLPAVVVPFYYPEATLGFDPETGEPLPHFAENPTMMEILRRGFIAITAEAYHLNYIHSDKDRDDFSRWSDAGSALCTAHPEWTGMGKLVADTRLLLDILEKDARVDSDRIGIAGHSLGGKAAFYTGCLDDRVKVIVASDFGILWEQSNWERPWYWGAKLDSMKAQGIDQGSLLASAAPKPFCLIAGKFDNEDSRCMLESVPGYEDCKERILIVNHRSGHRPPKYAADAGYGFLEHWLK